MKPNRLPPDDPREWIRRANSNLTIASKFDPQVELADLCFEAQPCGEKAIKAVFLKHGQSFPFTHDLHKLLRLLEKMAFEFPSTSMSQRN